jgi:F0F1-type ATP synthase membrane subunit b/b'
MESLATSSFNFLLLVGLLVFKLRKPVKDFVAQRHHLIRDEVQAVREQLKLAQEKYDEFSAKLKAIDAELASLREQAKQEVTSIKQRMTQEARRSSGLIVSDAKNAAEGLYADLKGQLYGELSARVLDRAETLLRERLTGDDRARIRKEFSLQVEKIQ